MKKIKMLAGMLAITMGVAFAPAAAMAGENADGQSAAFYTSLGSDTISADEKTAQDIQIETSNRTLKYHLLEAGSRTLKVLNVKDAHTALSFSKVSGADNITVNPKTGAVTVKKGTPRSTGTYRIGIRITAAGNSNYRAAIRSRTVHITVS